MRCALCLATTPRAGARLFTIELATRQTLQREKRNGRPRSTAGRSPRRGTVNLGTDRSRAWSLPCTHAPPRYGCEASKFLTGPGRGERRSGDIAYPHAPCNLRHVRRATRLYVEIGEYKSPPLFEQCAAPDRDRHESARSNARSLPPKVGRQTVVRDWTEITKPLINIERCANSAVGSCGQAGRIPRTRGCSRLHIFMHAQRGYVGRRRTYRYDGLVQFSTLEAKRRSRRT